MGDFACLGVGLAIMAFLCGPIALIVSITTRNRMQDLEEQLRQKPIKSAFEPFQPAEKPPVESPMPVEEPEIIEEEQEREKAVPAPWLAAQSHVQPIETPSVHEPIREPVHEEITAEPEPAPVVPSPPSEVAAFAEKMKKELAVQRLSMEVFLGTRGLAIAGSIAVLVGVIIGLKYLYDNNFIGPRGRTFIVAGCGLAALVIGQITRRRGYGIVATALAALGFAMLYAADFAAFSFYHIIGTNLAFGLAIVITAGGMLYAVRLNEIIVAFISLLGGFLSPVVLSSGENRPNTLFSYLLILIGGAMACAAVRKWRSVSRLSFVGTAILYSAWFYKWYHPAMYDNSMPSQLPVAVTWLSVFFLVYLAMPVLYELVKREVAHTGDVLLLMTNATFCYIYMHQILFTYHRSFLALAAVCLGAAHFGLMAAVHSRSPDDKKLKLILLTLGLFFVTIAIPLYLKMYAVALAWTGEGIVLTVIALRYRSQIVQLGSFAALALAVFALCRQLPLHDSKFGFIFNHAFGSWCFVAAAYYVVHLFYRREKEYVLAFTKEKFAQIFYTLSLALLFIASCLEWDCQSAYNLTMPDPTAFGKGFIVILAAFMVFYILPRLRPQGLLPYAASWILAIAAFISTIVYVPEFYRTPFTLVLNSSFGSAAFVAAMFCVAHLFYRFRKEDSPPYSANVLSQVFYCCCLALLLFAACMDWHGHTAYLAHPDTTAFPKGLLVLLASFMVIYIVPKLQPQGLLPYVASWILATAVFIATIVYLPDFYKGPFKLVANSSFGSTAFVAVMYYIVHWFYRRPKERSLSSSARVLAQIFYCGFLAMMLLAACMDWHGHTAYNLKDLSDTMFLKGLLVLLASFMVLYLIPRLRPQGLLPYIASAPLAIAAFVVTFASISDFYRGPFTFIANSSFSSVVFVAAAYYVAHLLHRHVKVRLLSDEGGYFAQILFCMSMIVLMAAAMMEWYGHTKYNLIPSPEHLYFKWFIKGAVVVSSAFVVLFLLPVFRPKGMLPVALATILALVTSIGTLVVFSDLYVGKFMIFANAPFVIGLAPLAALALAAILLYRSDEFPEVRKQAACGYGLGIIFFLWLLLTEEIYLYWHYPGHPTIGTVIDKGQMWISIMWAIYAAAIISVGLWRKFITLRYIGLCLFSIVLLKVFIFDMSTLEKIYRIAGFIVLGLVLIGMSFLYQYLRKTGFFEKSLS